VERILSIGGRVDGRRESCGWAGGDGFGHGPGDTWPAERATERVNIEDPARLGDIS